MSDTIRGLRGFAGAEDAAAQTAEGDGADRETRRAIVPPAGTTGGPLHTVIAVMCYLATLALGLVLTVNAITGTWSDGLSSAVTVQIKPSTDMAQEEQLARVLAVLRETPGLTEVEPISRAEAEDLLEPWLGGGALPPELDLPQLIDARIDLAAAPDLEALRGRLEAAAPGVVFDDHMRWKGRILAFSSSLQGMAVAALVLIGLATVAIVAFATRAGISANRDVVEVLHLIGARDGFIAGEIQRHYFWLGLRAGAIGAVLAALTLLALTLIGGSANTSLFLPGFSATAWVYLALAAVPLAATAVAVVTARLTTLRFIGKIL